MDWPRAGVLAILLALPLASPAAVALPPVVSHETAKVHSVLFARNAGVTSLLLESGVQVHIKPLSGSGIRIVALIAGPELLEAPGQRGLTRLIAGSLDLSAAPGWSCRAWPDGLALINDSAESDPAAALANLAILLTNPRLDGVLFTSAKAALLKESHDLSAAEQKQVSQAIRAIFDPSEQARALTMTPPVVQALTIEAAQAFATEQFAQRAIDVAVVGRVEPAQSVAVIKRAFGGVPARTRDRLDSARDAKRAAPTVRQVTSPVPSGQAYIVLALPAPAQSDLKAARLAQVVSKLMQAELQGAVREAGLKSLIVTGNALPGRTMPNLGVCVSTAVVEADAEQAGKLVQSAREHFARLAAQGPTQSAFDKARQSVLDELTPRVQTPDYWTTALPVAWFLGVPIDELASAPDTLRAARLDDLREHLSTWWQMDQLTALTVTPSDKPAP